MTATRFEMKVRPRNWDEGEHPRDRKGRFIETGAFVRIWGGGSGKVVGNVGNGRIEVERDSDGKRIVVHRNYLTVTARPNGEAPTDEESADVEAAPVTAATPDAEVVPDLAEADDAEVALPDRGEAPDHLVDTVTVGESQNGRTVGEWVDGPGGVDGHVVGFTEQGGPIVRTEDGKDWPLLPDAEVVANPDGPEMPEEWATGEAPAPAAPAAPQSDDQRVLDRAIELQDRGEAASHDEAVAMAQQQIADEGAAPVAQAPEEQPLASVNPSNSGVFEDYESGREYRATAPLADNMTTLAETEGVDPDETVTLYRGVPDDAPEGVQPGDFVTTNEQLARDYMGGTGRIEQIEARYGDVLDDRDEPGGEEYIYRPQAAEAAPEAQAPAAPEAQAPAATPADMSDSDLIAAMDAMDANTASADAEALGAEYERREREAMTWGPADDITPEERQRRTERLDAFLAFDALNRDSRSHMENTRRGYEQPASDVTPAAPAAPAEDPNADARAAVTAAEQALIDFIEGQPDPAGMTDRERDNQRRMLTSLIDNEMTSETVRGVARRRVDAIDGSGNEVPAGAEPRGVVDVTGRPDPSGMSDADLRSEFDSLDLPLGVIDEQAAGLAESNETAIPGDTPGVAAMRARRNAIGAEIDDRAAAARQARAGTGSRFAPPEGDAAPAPQGADETVRAADLRVGDLIVTNREGDTVEVIEPPAIVTGTWRARVREGDTERTFVIPNAERVTIRQRSVAEADRGSDFDAELAQAAERRDRAEERLRKDPVMMATDEHALVGAPVLGNLAGTDGSIGQRYLDGADDLTGDDYRDLAHEFEAAADLDEENASLFNDLAEGMYSHAGDADDAARAAVDTPAGPDASPEPATPQMLGRGQRPATEGERVKIGDIKPGDTLNTLGMGDFHIAEINPVKRAAGRAAGDGGSGGGREMVGVDADGNLRRYIVNSDLATFKRIGEGDAPTLPERTATRTPVAEIKPGDRIDLPGQGDAIVVDVRTGVGNTGQSVDLFLDRLDGDGPRSHRVRDNQYVQRTGEGEPVNPDYQRVMAEADRRFADPEVARNEYFERVVDDVNSEIRNGTLTTDDLPEAPAVEPDATPEPDAPAVTPDADERVQARVEELLQRGEAEDYDEAVTMAEQQIADEDARAEAVDLPTEPEQVAPPPPSASRGRRTTFTTPDGVEHTRNSKNNAYTHVVVVGPATPEDRRAAFNREADALDAQAARLEAAAAAGRVKKRNRGFDGPGVDAAPTNFHAYEFGLVDPDAPASSGGRRRNDVEWLVSTRGNVENRADLSYATDLDVDESLIETRTESRFGGDKEIPTIGVREYLVARARRDAERKREEAATLREQGEQPDTDGYSVLRWSSNATLARRAAENEFAYQRERYGKRVYVAEVDSAQEPAPAPAPGPEPDQSGGTPTPPPAPGPDGGSVPKVANQRAAAKYIAATAGVTDPEMVRAVQDALSVQITPKQGEGRKKVWESGNADLIALTQAAIAGAQTKPEGPRRKAWDPDAAQTSLQRLADGDPTLPTSALVGQRVGLDVLDMDAPIVLGRPAASKRVEGVVRSVESEYTWSMRVLIDGDDGEVHTAVFPAGGFVPRAADPDAPIDHPARDIADADPDPIEFRYVRNPQSSTTNVTGNDFGQDIEPAGRYLNSTTDDAPTPDGWETGRVSFQKPLIMDFGGGYNEQDNWKRRLSAHYGGLTGEALSDAVRADGYDAIITRDKYGDSEIVDLSNGAAEVTPDRAPDVTGGEFNPDDWIVRQRALRNLAQHYGITFAEAESRFGDRLERTGQSNLVTASSMRALMAERDVTPPALPRPILPDPDTDPEGFLAATVAPLPDLTRDPGDLTDDEIAAAIKGIDDNIITVPEGTDERTRLLGYRARLVGEQQRRNAVVPPPSPDPVDQTEVTLGSARAGDLAVGDKVVFDDGTLAEITSKDEGDGGLALGYRDGGGNEGIYLTDADTVFQRVEADGPTPPIAPAPDENPDPEVGREAQVTAQNLVPGDTLWLGGDKVTVDAIAPRDADMMDVTVRYADRRTATYPFGREAVLDRADDSFLPDPSPLDSDVATSRPVLYTYQRRNIVALGLDNDPDPMVAEAARRIRKRQPLAAAHSATLAARLSEMSAADGIKPQRSRMLVRLAYANNAAAIEAGGRGVDLPPMPNADRVTKGRPGDMGVGDQIAFVDERGRLRQGKVANVRRLMGGRLTEVTYVDPDGVEWSTMLSRNTDVYVLPDLPEPIPVPQSNDLPELVTVADLRPGDRIRIPSRTTLFDAEMTLTEATVVSRTEGDHGFSRVTLDVHSVDSMADDQAFELTSNPEFNEEIVRVSRGAESTDQPRSRDLPAFAPEEINASEVGVGDWLQVVVGGRGASYDGIVTQIEVINDEDGNRVGQRFAFEPVGGGGRSNWFTVTDREDYTMTRLVAGDRNTVLRMEEERRERLRSKRQISVAGDIGIALDGYSRDLSFYVNQNALGSGGNRDEFYEQFINEAFAIDDAARPEWSTRSMDLTRVTAIRNLTRDLQVALSGETSGPAHAGVREAAAGLAEQIVNDHHERVRQGLLDVRPTTPGQTRTEAGAHLARMLSVGTTSIESRDAMKLARGIVLAREQREAAGQDGGEVARDFTVPDLPEGTSLSDRMAAYKQRMSSRFGFRDSEVTTFADFDLDSLERGEVPALATTVTRTPDRARDTGPGADTMAQLEVLRAAGADLDAEIQKRIDPSLPGQIEQAETEKTAAYARYESLRKQENAIHADTQNRLAREHGFADWNAMSFARLGDARHEYEARTGEPLSDAVARVRAQVTEEVSSIRALGDEAYDKWKTIDQRWKDIRARLAETRAKAARDVLAEVRDMGGVELSYRTAGRRKMETTQTPLRNGETMKAMRFAEQHYPKEWLDLLNGSPKGAIAIGTTARGFFQETAWIIRLSKDDNRNGATPWVPPRGRVATHELGHAMETVVPGLAKAEEAFLWSRTASGEIGERKRKRTKTTDGSPVYGDEFKGDYSGKDYGDGKFYELFTTGAESLFAGSDYMDDDYRRWMLGVLALL